MNAQGLNSLNRCGKQLVVAKRRKGSPAVCLGQVCRPCYELSSERPFVCVSSAIVRRIGVLWIRPDKFSSNCDTIRRFSVIKEKEYALERLHLLRFCDQDFETASCFRHRSWIRLSSSSACHGFCRRWFSRVPQRSRGGIS